MSKLRRSFAQLFATWGAFLDAAFFRPAPTIADDIAQRRARIQREVVDCEKLIRKASFQKYMACAESRALTDWEKIDV